MATADEKATYEISLKENYTKKVQGMNKATQGFEGTLGSLGKKLIGVYAAKEALQGIANIAKMSLKLAGGMESTEIAFGTFLGSAKKGKEVLDNLNEFANRTPFTNDQIIKTGRSLLAANIPAEKLTGTLGMIGDIAAGANVPITDLGSIYAKVMNKGKLQAEELNQLAERGIPIIAQLAEEFGVTKQEVFDLGSKGKITSDVMVKAFKSMTQKGGKFFNLMEKQSASAEGLLSTLEGKTEMLGISLGKRMLPAQKALTRQTISLVDKLNDWIKVPVSEELQKQNNEYNGLILMLRDTNIKEEDRARILARLQEINPKTNELIKQEGDQLVINEAALKAYNAQQINNIILKKEEEKIAKAASKLQDLQVRKRMEEVELAKKMEILGGVISKSNKISNIDKQKSVDILTSEGAILDKQNKLRQLGYSISKKSGALSTDIVKRATNASFLLETTKRLNSAEEDYNGVLGERDKLAKDLGIDLGGSKTIIPGKIDDPSGVVDGITKITAAAPKVFNININNLVENFDISTTNLTEAAGDIREQVTMALAEGLADVQPLVR